MTRPGVFLKLKSTRKKIQSGDIFVCSVEKDKYIWGRVIRDKDVAAFSSSMTEGIYLVYLYNTITEDTLKVPELRKENLLIAPIAVTKHEWTSGYFQLVGYKELETGDVLNQHCFHVFAKLGGKIIADRYEDEYGNKLDTRYDPCGNDGLINLNGLYKYVINAVDEKERVEVENFILNSTLTFPKQTKEIKTKEPTQIQIKIKIKDLNNPNMDMLTLEELFEDIITKKPFTGNYDELNQDPLIVILETTNTKKAIEIIKEIMDKASFINPTINKKEKLFKDYTVEVIED